MTDLTAGARVRHAEWGDGVVLDVKAMLPSRPALYRCQFVWSGWGHRIRHCYADELVVVVTTVAPAAQSAPPIDPPDLVA